MNAAVLYTLMGVGLFSIGLHGFLAQPHLLRKVLALNIMGSGVFAVLMATAWRGPQLPPDPVPHALVLTGIVVAVSATAFALALLRRIHTATGRASLPEDTAA
ncbi:MAG: NADH-quinone oxidoreductase subunit K [Candidatus Binatia bacterium]|nr:NADH-quinone oxidoreductase subunit K [Candidatus Binatia bacterium]